MTGHARRAGRGSVLVPAISLLLAIGASAPARAADPPPKTSAQVEALVGVLYDNNAALGRRGLFRGQKLTDVTSVLGLKLTLQSELHRRVRLLLLGKLRAEEGRWRQNLRNTEAQLKPSLELSLGKDIDLTPAVSFKLHHEVESIWSYLEVAPSLLFKAHTRFATIFELGYDFTATMFDQNQDTVTYANVDKLSHLGKLHVKIFPARKLLAVLKTEVEYQTYDDNIGETLAAIAFAPIEQYGSPDLDPEVGVRRDLYLRGELDLLWMPRKDLALALSYKVEWDRSNLDPYRNWNHGPRLAALFVTSRHEAYAEAQLVLSDFYDFRFDTRYANTRIDVRLEAYAVYQVKLSESWRVGAKASYKTNFSNDAMRFPDGSYRFDPRYSRSFSRYDGVRVEAFFTYTWDLEKARPAASPDPMRRLAARR